VVFLCNRRSLGSWSRTMSSTAVEEFNFSVDHTIEPQKFRVTPSQQRRMKLGEHALLETFSFVPTIQAEDGEVRLSYTDRIPEKAFAFRRDPASQKTIDYVMTTPWEPIETLEIEVEFHDVVPGRISADALYGPASQPLPREALQADEILREFDQDGKRVVALKVPFPLLGVGYRIKWELE
jgi:hypothetical protein